jgi:hypothetical protein
VINVCFLITGVKISCYQLLTKKRKGGEHLFDKCQNVIFMLGFCSTIGLKEGDFYFRAKKKSIAFAIDFLIT